MENFPFWFFFFHLLNFYDIECHKETKMGFPMDYKLGWWQKYSHVGAWLAHSISFFSAPGSFRISCFRQVPTPVSHFHTMKVSRIILDFLQCAWKKLYVPFIVFRTTWMTLGVQSGNIILNKRETRKSSPCCIFHAISISNVFPLPNCFSPELHSARDN